MFSLQVLVQLLKEKRASLRQSRLGKLCQSAERGGCDMCAAWEAVQRKSSSGSRIPEWKKTCCSVGPLGSCGFEGSALPLLCTFWGKLRFQTLHFFGSSGSSSSTFCTVCALQPRGAHAALSTVYVGVVLLEQGAV